MPNNPMSHIKSGGRRMDLYAELGRYFAPDGQLNEAEFRDFLREALKARLADGDIGAIRLEVSQWLSAHLEDVLAYLEERGLSRGALSLFEVAVDESAALGLETVALSPARLQRLLAGAREMPDDTIAARRRDPDEKRRKIFEAAIAVFAERGFHESTMDEIAARSGVAKGTLYRYFASKEDLLDHLLKTTSQQVAGRFAEAFTRGGGVLDQIEAFVVQWVAFIEENHVLYRLIQSEGINGPEGRQTMFYEYLLADFPMVKERVAALDRDGLLKTPNFHTVAYGMLGFIDGVARKWFRSGMDYPLRDEIPVILEVLFNGFVRDQSRSRRFYSPPE